MKKTVFVILAFALALQLPAQNNANSKDISWANINSPFVVNDIYGNPVDLQAWLDSGFCVVIDYSATWCYPCYVVHNSGLLEALYHQLGPNGENRLRLVWVETQGASLNTLQNSSIGNWTVTRDGEPVPYPIVSSTTYINICRSIFDNAIPYIVFVKPDGQYCSIYNEDPVIIDPGDVSGTVSRVRDLLDQYSNRPVGVSSVEEPEISIFPNPTTGNVFINGEILSVQIVDLKGRIVAESSANPMDLSTLPKGLYIVRINTCSGVTTRKIILQ